MIPAKLSQMSQAFQENEKLRSFFTVLSTNVAENEAHFISTLEGNPIMDVNENRLAVVALC